MSRQPDTHDRQSHLPAKVQIDDGEGNRDTGLAVQYVIQEAIARIVIVLLIAVKAHLVKEIGIDAGDDMAWVELQPEGTACIASAMVSRRLEIVCHVERLDIPPGQSAGRLRPDENRLGLDAPWLQSGGEFRRVA